MIDPEAAPPAPRARRHRRAVVAGVTLLALVAGGIVAGTGDDPDAKPLALMAGNGAGGAETMSADAAGPVPVAPALGSAAARSSMPYGWGLKFEVVGQLPALPDHAVSWDVNTPDLDRASIGRIAEALGVPGAPVQRDGGWFVEGGDWSLSAYGGDAMGKGGAWYLNLYRGRSDGQPADTAADRTPGPAIARAEAEQRVRDLLTRMGAPRASWKIETTDTEIGVGWACAAPGMSPEEMRKLEAEKIEHLERENAASSTAVDPAPPVGSGAGSSGSAGATPAGKPAADSPVAPCPAPPPPVKGFNVALFPLLDGRRADWPVWNVTMRSDGRIENLYGSWVNFDRGGDYKLRGVDAALKDLQSPPGVAYGTDSPAAAIEPAIDLPAAPPLDSVSGADPADSTEPAGATDSAGAAEPANPAGSSAAATPTGGTMPAGATVGTSASGRRPLRGDVASAPAVDLPVHTPVCPPMPMPMPMPVEDAKATTSVASGCVAPAPQIVKITGVDLGLIQTSVWEDGQIRMALVPSYRFAGHFDNGQPWETSVLALHPSAIAPPPDVPMSNGVRTDGGATGGGAGFGAVPPPPTAEPAILRDGN